MTDEELKRKLINSRLVKSEPIIWHEAMEMPPELPKGSLLICLHKGHISNAEANVGDMEINYWGGDEFCTLLENVTHWAIVTPPTIEEIEAARRMP